jgi:alpha-tubulin suppressor-like RCC1 family protein
VALVGCDEDPPCGGRTGDTNDAEVSVVQLTAGWLHTCALLSNGAVRCWGYGAEGQLGRGNTCDVGDDETPAQAGDVLLGGRAVSIDAGGVHTCAVLDTGAVRCWGSGAHGRLGHGNCVSDSRYDQRCNIGDDETPARAGDVPVGRRASNLALGRFGIMDHTCALLDTGAVRCWGQGGWGILGYGSCASTEDDDLSCAIGDDETPATAGDVDVGGEVVQVDAGGATTRGQTCAVLSTGAVRCWGPWVSGGLGYAEGPGNDVGDDETPADMGDVQVGGAVVEVAAGGNHTCALLQGGRVRCWGWNEYGELGYGNRASVGFAAGDFPSLAGDVDVGGIVVQLATGDLHTCALLDTGAVRCWGRGWYLGYGNTLTIGDDEAPADAGDIPLGGPAIQIAAGQEHTCALMATGAVRCWGAGQRGRLGYGNCAASSELDTACTIGDDETPADVGDVPLFAR